MQEKLRDIKPLIEIPDYSYWVYYGLIAAAIVLVAAIVAVVALRLWRMRKENLAKRYLAALKSIDWHDSKKAAYEATRYGRLIATDRRLKELYDQLLPLLEKYKYKKEVEPVDQETLNKFNLFVQVADESI